MVHIYDRFWVQESHKPPVDGLDHGDLQTTDETTLQLVSKHLQSRCRYVAVSYVNVHLHVRGFFRKQAGHPLIGGHPVSTEKQGLAEECAVINH